MDSRAKTISRTRRTSPAPGRPRPRRGFTLIELTLITVVIGILLAAAIPRLHHTARRMRVEHMAFELTHLLRAAHELAVTTGEETVWVWDEDARQAWVTPGSSVVPDPSDSSDVITSSTMLEGTEVLLTRDAFEVGCRCIHFYPEGTSESTTVGVSFGDQVYTATVDAITSQVTLIAGTPAR